MATPTMPYRRRWCRLALAAGVAVSLPFVSESPMAGSALQHTIEIRQAQSGFAGVTGKIWTVEPSGAWRVQSFMNDRIEPAAHSGQLEPGQLATLAAGLEQLNLPDLPSRLGEPPPVNPSTVTISYGGTQVTAVIEPGTEDALARPPAASPPDDVTGRVVHFAQQVRAATDD
ncbi:MAG TPA: hypothetical protein VFG43_08115 [Geminicoccaceae bacterium]|nr:hypothetical protein [Geminicoccaceae bacterium]